MHRSTGASFLVLKALLARKMVLDQRGLNVTMDKLHLINLYHLAAQVTNEFQSAMRNKLQDAELGKRARIWAEAEISR